MKNVADLFKLIDNYDCYVDFRVFVKDVVLNNLFDIFKDNYCIVIRYFDERMESLSYSFNNDILD